PRVIHLAEKYNQIAGEQRVFFVEVTEQEIMDWELTANHNGHIACTHGGESLAGLVRARQTGLVDTDETAVVDSTAHALKFAGFQEMYFENRFPDEFGIHPDPRLMNRPVYMRPDDLEKVPAPGNPIDGEDFEKFVRRVSEEIARTLDLVAL
ncbi:MAG: threonine synthase, partial [Desulfococcus multivorans]|nr:threonine synthase [Desulfococcus multivorans]